MALTKTEQDAVHDLRLTAALLRAEAVKAKQNRKPGEFRNLELRLGVGAVMLEETARFIEKRAARREVTS